MKYVIIFSLSVICVWQFFHFRELDRRHEHVLESYITTSKQLENLQYDYLKMRGMLHILDK